MNLKNSTFCLYKAIIVMENTYKQNSKKADLRRKKCVYRERFGSCSSRGLNWASFRVCYGIQFRFETKNLVFHFVLRREFHGFYLYTFGKLSNFSRFLVFTSCQHAYFGNFQNLLLKVCAIEQNKRN